MTEATQSGNVIPTAAQARAVASLPRCKRLMRQRGSIRFETPCDTPLRVSRRNPLHALPGFFPVCSRVLRGLRHPDAACDACPRRGTRRQPCSAAFAGPRLKIELVAEQPALVTPTGIDVDERGRVFVLESNTHFPPEGYKGHPTDRVLIFPEATAPGIAGANPVAPADVKPIVFADGFTHAMSVVVRPTWFPAPPTSDPREPKTTENRSPATTVYVATRRDIFVLQDFDGDGHADSRYVLIHLETDGNYPHNALAGFALHPLGWLYFGFGENLGAAYTLNGPDGTKLSEVAKGGTSIAAAPTARASNSGVPVSGIRMPARAMPSDGCSRSTTTPTAALPVA